MDSIALPKQFLTPAEAATFARISPSTLKRATAAGEIAAVRHRMADGYAGRSGRGVRPATLDEYRRLLDRDALPYFGRQRLADITTRDVRRFADTVAARGVAPDTGRLAVAVVKLVLASALDDGIIVSNPASPVRVARVKASQKRQQRALTTVEVDAIIQAVPKPHRLLVRLLSETGLRMGEVIALRWHDVHLDDRQPTIHVRRRIYRGMVDAPKTSAGVRRVPLTAHVAADIRMARLASRFPGDDDPVFPSPTGAPLDPANVSRWFKPAARTAGVPWASPHSLRHYCATEFARRGLAPAHSAVWLGHADIRLTLAVYTHLVDADLPTSPFDRSRGTRGDTRGTHGSIPPGRIAEPGRLVAQQLVAMSPPADPRNVSGTGAQANKPPGIPRDHFRRSTISVGCRCRTRSAFGRRRPDGTPTATARQRFRRPGHSGPLSEALTTARSNPGGAALAWRAASASAWGAAPVGPLTLASLDPGCWHAPSPAGGWPVAPIGRPHATRGGLNDVRFPALFHLEVDVEAPDRAPVYAVTSGVLTAFAALGSAREHFNLGRYQCAGQAGRPRSATGPPMIRKRRSLAAASTGDRVFAIGGYNPTRTALSSVEAFTPTTQPSPC